MATDVNELIRNIIAKLPAELQDSAVTLSDALVKMSSTQIQDIWALVMAGDTEAPLKASLSAMTSDELDADGVLFTAQVQANAQANADSVKAQKSALSAIASAILACLLAAL
jgi:hypothetical protein